MTAHYWRITVPLSIALSLGLASCEAAEPTGHTAATSEASAPAQTTKVITDIAHWQHPTKAVFAKYGVTLNKVTIVGHYPTFEVQFPFDPQTSPNEKILDALCTALLKANGQWPYALVSPDDQVEFDVEWNRQEGKVLIDNQAYPASEHPN